MGKPTGTLTIVRPDKTETMSWNGVVADRDAAREAFDAVMRTRTYFAFVETSPGKGDQVRSFEEVEQIEKKVGTVNVTVQPSMVGG